MERHSILILQNPFKIKALGRFQVLTKLKQEKDIRIISLIHDVELLRYDTPKARAEFKETLEIADQLIVHNDNHWRFLIISVINHRIFLQNFLKK